MDGRKYQRKSGIKRTLVMLLALVMLASVCFPAMRVNAEETLECTCGTENETHTEGCPKYVAPQNDDEGNTAECTCGTENETHTEGCPKYVAPQNGGEGDTKECNCNAENGVHAEGCPKYVAPLNGGEGDTKECTCNAENGVHAEGCPKYVAPLNGGEGDTKECTCNAENGVHAEGCPKYVAPLNGGEGDTKECTCNAENGVHTEGCPKYVAPLNGGEGDTKECTCNAENGVHAEGCPKYVAPLNGGEGDTKECTCNAENGVHTEGCPKYVAPLNGGEGDTKECTCNAENGVHTEGCPKYVAPQNDDEDSSMSDAAKNYLSRIEECKAEIAKLDPDASDYEDQWRRIFDDLIIIQRDVSTDWEEYILSDDEFEMICSAAEALKNQLGDPYDAATYADDPQMKYYNKNNNLAYDVAQTKTSGYNDSLHTYVASVTLGGVGVQQADSNRSYGVDSNNGRVGKKLSSYYGDLNTGDAVTNKTLEITPKPGYYVTRVVVACCDGGAPYYCGTWAQEKAFDEKFNVSAGGTLSVKLPSSAFGHGAWNSLESRFGWEQYFILIQVAPVPTPLYIEYDYGEMGNIMGGDLSSSVFADHSQWTGVGGSNEMGRGRIDTQYTQYRYEYNSGRPNEVADWKHYANIVTDEAKKAAAAKGYYFAGWEATYYTECDSEYKFSNEYSEETTHYKERAQVNLITNVRLVAQWKPVELSAEKIVRGLHGTRFAGEQHTYQLTVYRKNLDGSLPSEGKNVSLNVTGDSSASTVAISPAVPGTYVIKETDNGGNLGNGTETMYISVADGTEVTITVKDILEGKTSPKLTVTNTYSKATPKIKLVKQWQDVNGDPVSGEATSAFPAVQFEIKNAEGNVVATETVSYSDNWEKVIDIPEGYTAGCTVSEVVPANYTQVGDVVTTTESKTVDGLNYVYTVYTATNKMSTASVTIKKEVKGNMGDPNKSFSFTVTLTDGTMTAGEYTAADGSSVEYTVSNDGTKVNFSLKGGQKVVLKDVPLNAKLTVTETNAGAYSVTIDGTLVKAQGTPGDAFKSNITVTEGKTITVVNENEATIDTGIVTDSIPYVLLLTMAVIGAGVLLLNKRRVF